ADVGAGSVEGVAGAGPAAARTSSSVTRPPGPLPRTAFRSTPSSRASRRVDGVAGTGPSRRAGASAAGACLARPSAITVFGPGPGQPRAEVGQHESTRHGDFIVRVG